MTKFILAGGYPTKTEDGGALFAQELVKGFDEPVRILDCLFARPEDTWTEVFQKDRLFFSSKLKQNIILELAEPGQFVEQLRRADVVYFRGGTTKSLIAALKGCVGWEKELESKTVAGTSAGANFLAKYYYSLGNLEVHEGLGVLPIKVIVHYESDFNAPNIHWDTAYQDLKVAGEELPIYPIREGEFDVIES